MDGYGEGFSKIWYFVYLIMDGEILGKKGTNIASLLLTDTDIYIPPVEVCPQQKYGKQLPYFFIQRN
jgi:hypothetical protein